MTNHTFLIENLLQSFPDDREDILLYQDKVKKYSRECGCSMGAKFLIVSLAISVIYFLHFNVFGSGIGNLLSQAALETVFILATTIVGKLLGMGVARLRLVLLNKQLIAKYSIRRG